MTSVTVRVSTQAESEVRIVGLVSVAAKSDEQAAATHNDRASTAAKAHDATRLSYRTSRLKESI
jgi:hypothetical protein